MKDLHSNIGAVLALAPAVQSATVAGVAIDTQGFESLTFALNTGAIVSSGDFAASLTECDTSGGTYTTVADAEVQTDAPATLEASSTYKLGYLGHKRFVKINLTKTGGTSIAAGATAILGDAHSRPVA